MFKRNFNAKLPNHVECYTYQRDKKTQGVQPEAERIAIENFYFANGIKHYDLPTSGQKIHFKRTLNFVYITEHFLSKSPNAKYKAQIGSLEGYGIIRSKSWVFYRGIILFTLDHDYNEYPSKATGTTTTTQKKCIKLNYATHEELNNSDLNAVGKHCESFEGFDKACKMLLVHDDTPHSINFIKEA